MLHAWTHAQDILGWPARGWRWPAWRHAGVAHADPQADDAQWIANHIETRLLGADGKPIVGLPRWTRMRIMRGLPERTDCRSGCRASTWSGASASTPSARCRRRATAELDAEKLDGPTCSSAAIGLPGRVAGGANLRTWPGVGDNLLRTLGHNAPAARARQRRRRRRRRVVPRQLARRRHGRTDRAGLHAQLARPVAAPARTRPRTPDRATGPGRHFEADLKEPALLTAFEDGAPIWSTLTLKGTISNRTPTGVHQILWRVPNETMTSERVYPPIPRDAPGGYYLKNVLFTQYFTSDGASIHYNYWSSNWGYAGSHGCLGVAYNEAKFAWDWADVGTPRLRLRLNAQLRREQIADRRSRSSRSNGLARRPAGARLGALLLGVEGGDEGDDRARAPRQFA